MFYDFNRHKRAQTPAPAEDILAERIAKKCMNLQRKLSGFAHRKFSKLSQRWQVLIFYLTFISTGCFCVYLIVSGVTSKSLQSFLPTPIDRILIPANRSGELEKQRAFEAYLDSLENAFIQDSINQSNPKQKNDATQNTLP